jgi:plasmid replication initiation protein
MSQRPDPHPIRDFFIADIIDYAPKDERTMMERPFFSLSKRKRNKPIEYESDDGKVWVKVRAHPEVGMATIWDADILIWCISKIVAERNRGQNLETATIHTTPYELLKGIARGTSGTELRNSDHRGQ